MNSPLKNFKGNLDIKYVKLYDGGRAPRRSTSAAAAYDLYAASSGSIPPRAICAVGTGIAIRLPQLHEPYICFARIESRSGLALKGVVTEGGVIDADYSQEVKVILHNTTSSEYSYNGGDRIAQLILELTVNLEVVEVAKLPDIENNTRAGGFGSTGV